MTNGETKYTVTNNNGFYQLYSYTLSSNGQTSDYKLVASNQNKNIAELWRREYGC